MALTTALIEVLKRELKSRDITYADVARHLDLSEASIKRMFSAKDFMLSRLDDICEFAGVEFTDLARAVEARDTLLLQLSPEQEKELAGDIKLMLVAVASIHHLTFEQIIQSYQLTETELIGLLTGSIDSKSSNCNRITGSGRWWPKPSPGCRRGRYRCFFMRRRKPIFFVRALTVKARRWCLRVAVFQRRPARN